MNDVPENLQTLIRRRLREMGTARGRDAPLSLREAHEAVAEPRISYEIVRRAEKGQHSRIGADAVRTIATMLDVNENDVRAAAGQPPDLGPFELPARANALDPDQRGVVLSVVDAILQASVIDQPTSAPQSKLPTGIRRTGADPEADRARSRRRKQQEDRQREGSVDHPRNTGPSSQEVGP